MNSEKDIIKQALLFVNENNKFAIRSITNNSLPKSNFYKLSSEPESEISLMDEDIIDESSIDSPIVPPEFDEDLSSFLYPEEHRTDEDSDEDTDEDTDDDSDEDSDEEKSSFWRRKETWYQKLVNRTRDSQAKAIMDLYGIDVHGKSQKEIADALKEHGVHFETSGSRMPSTRILNTNLGRK